MHLVGRAKDCRLENQTDPVQVLQHCEHVCVPCWYSVDVSFRKKTIIVVKCMCYVQAHLSDVYMNTSNPTDKHSIAYLCEREVGCTKKGIQPG